MKYRDKYFPEYEIKYQDKIISVRGKHCGDKCPYRRKRQGVVGDRSCILFKIKKLGTTDYFGSEFLLNRCDECLNLSPVDEKGER